MNTIILIEFLAVFVALFCQQKKIPCESQEQAYCYKYFNPIFFWLSFWILAIGCFISKSGIDMAHYVYFYNTWTISDVKELDFEPGSRIIFVMLHMLIKDPYIGIGIIKTCSIFLVYKSIELLKDKLNVALSVLVYCVLIYIYNFHLIRMCLAIGIVYYAIANLIIGKNKKTVMLLIIAAFIHYSSIFLSLTIVLYSLTRKRFTRRKGLLIFLLCYVMLSYVGEIIVSLSSTISFMSKYNAYINMSAYEGSGIVQTIMFIPTFLLIYLRFYLEKNSIQYPLYFFLGIMTFFSASLGYIFPVAGRTTYYFYSFFILYAAGAPLKDDCFIFNSNIKSIKNISVYILFTYLIMQIYLLFFVGNSVVSNGLEKFYLFWK